MPTNGGASEKTLDTGWTPRLIATDQAVYVRYESGSLSSWSSRNADVTRIDDDPARPRARMHVGSSMVAPDQGYVYLTGHEGVFRTRDDFCELVRMSDAPITSSSAVVVHGDRLYWCEQERLVTRRASVTARPDCSPRPSAPRWTTPATQGEVYESSVRADLGGAIYAVVYESEAASSISGVFPGLYLMKYDSNGVAVWGRWLPGTWVTQLDVDAAGSVLVRTHDGSTLSRYASDGSLDWQVSLDELAAFTASGSVVTFAAVPDTLHQLDSAGNIVSSVPAPGNGALDVVHMIGDTSGGVVLSGRLYAPVDLGQGAVGAAGDAFLLRLDASFAPTWFRNISGASNIARPAASPNGGLVIIGSATPGTDLGAGPVTDAPNSPFSFIASYDSAGNLRWRRVWAGGGGDVAVAGDGAIVATTKASQGWPSTGLGALAGCWMPISSQHVIKLGVNGDFLWAEPIAADTYKLGVTATLAGEAVVTGRIGSPDATSSFLMQLAP